MASNPEKVSNGYRITWYYDGRKQRFTEPKHADSMLLKKYVEALGGRIRDDDPLLTGKAHLHGGVVPVRLDPDRGVITFVMAAESYLATRRWQSNTEDQFRGRLKNHYGDWSGFDVTRLDDSHLNAKFKSFLRAGYAESTAVTYIEPALQILTFAFDRGWLEVNPVRSRYLAFKRSVPGSDSRVALTGEEYEAILALALDLVTYDIILTMGQCGLRIGEVFALNVEDVDLENQTLTVRATMHKCRRQLWAKGARNRKPRVIALNSAFCVVLRIYVEGKSPTAPLFPGPRAGRHQSPDNWRDRVWNVMRDEAVEKKIVRPHVELVPHVLRHSMATWYAAHIPVRLVGERLGHTTERVTNGYISRNLGLERDVMDKVFSTPHRGRLAR